MKRITLKDFRNITRGLPEDSIICCQSDSEGNEISTCLNVFTGQVGKDVSMTYCGETYHFTDGEDVIGIDLDKDKDKVIITLQPSL